MADPKHLAMALLGQAVPCRYCGANPRTQTGVTWRRPGGDYNGPLAWCNGNACVGRRWESRHEASCPVTFVGSTLDAAISAWNAHHIDV